MKFYSWRPRTSRPGLITCDAGGVLADRPSEEAVRKAEGARRGQGWRMTFPTTMNVSAPRALWASIALAQLCHRRLVAFWRKS